MSLSTVNVKMSLYEKTVAFLKANVSYNVLREYALSVEPVPEIMHRLEVELDRVHQQDKISVKTEAERKACQRQAEDDRAEAERDRLDEEHDNRQRDALMIKQHDLRQRMTRLNIDIGLKESQLFLLSTRDHPQQHRAHEHGHNEHAHSTQHVHPTQHDLDLNEQLREQRVRSLMRALARDQVEQKNIQRDLDNIVKKLNDFFPQRSAQRRVRGEARAARNQARNMAQDLNLDQLTQANRQALHAELQASYQRLDEQKRNLMASGQTMAYGIYLKALLTSLPNMTESEKTALRHVAHFMQQHVHTKEQEKDARIRLQQAEQLRQNAAQNLKQKKEKVQEAYAKTSNFKTNNEFLNQKNVELREKLNTQTLILTLALLFGVIALTGMVGFFMAIPLAIPVVAMIVSIISFCVAGISAYLAFGLKKTITTNEDTIRQHENLMNMESVEIPDLEKSLKEQDAFISELKKEITGYVEKASSYLAQAYDVKPTRINTASMHRDGLFARDHSAYEADEETSQFQAQPPC